MEGVGVMTDQPRTDDGKLTLTWEQWEAAKRLADERTKANNGHSFVTILKTRCQFCGRSPKQKGRCGAWFQTFLSQLDTILLGQSLGRSQL